MVVKCGKCNLPLISVRILLMQGANHQCAGSKKAQDSRPVLEKSKIQLQVNPSALFDFHGPGVLKSPKDMFNLKVLSIKTRYFQVPSKQQHNGYNSLYGYFPKTYLRYLHK